MYLRITVSERHSFYELYNNFCRHKFCVESQNLNTIEVHNNILLQKKLRGILQTTVLDRQLGDRDLTSLDYYSVNEEKSSFFNPLETYMQRAVWALLDTDRY